MITTPSEPTFPPGTRLRVVQHVRIGSHRWSTEVVGVVTRQANRPVGGMEMGAKSQYCRQPALHLTLDDGELTVVALDENSEVHVLSGS